MKVRRITGSAGGSYREFLCPGCNDTHMIPVTGPQAWGFNGDDSAPTFTPSILVHSHGVLDEHGNRRETPRCHSFVTAGRIQFLGDCTHALAGQTVDLPEITEA